MCLIFDSVCLEVKLHMQYNVTKYSDAVFCKLYHVTTGITDINDTILKHEVYVPAYPSCPSPGAISRSSPSPAAGM